MKNRWNHRILTAMTVALIFLDLIIVLNPGPVRAEEETGYPLYLGQTRVTDANKDDILGDGGKAKYDPATNTLTLDNPTIAGGHLNSMISSGLEQLYIKGTCDMHTDEDWIIKSSHDVHFNGSFSFSNNCFGILAAGCVVESGMLYVRSVVECIKVFSFTVKQDVERVELIGSPQAGETILEGTMGYSEYSDEYWTVIVPNGIRTYSVWVGDEQIGSWNCQDIFGDGKAIFDPATNTLTLDDPVIEGAHTVTGNNAYNAKICSYLPLTITGRYTMTRADAMYGVIVFGHTVTLDGDLTFCASVDAVYTGDNPEATEIDEYGYGTRRGGAVLNGNITLTGGRDALRADGDAALNGNITLTGGSNGLYALSKTTLTGGNISISGGQRGILTLGGFEMTGGVADITGQEVQSLDIRNRAAEISGGSLSVKSLGGIAGIYVYNADIRINGGRVTAVCQRQDATYSTGLKCVNGTVYVSGNTECVTLDGQAFGLQAKDLVFSNTGSQNMRIVEPGWGIFLQKNGGVYYTKGGTTAYAAPHVVLSHAYPISLGNTFVYPGNCQDIFGDGTAAFDPDTNVLTLNDPVIEGYSTDAAGEKMLIYASGIPLTIRGSYQMPEGGENPDMALVVKRSSLSLDGTFTFRGKRTGIYVDGDFQAVGEIDAEGGDRFGVAVADGDLHLAGGKFTAGSDMYGVYVNKGMLVLEPGLDRAVFTGPGKAAIMAGNGISFPADDGDRIVMTRPARGVVRTPSVFDPDYVPSVSGTDYVVPDGTVYAARLVQFEKERQYGVTVGGVRVTSLNMNDILGDGKASYDPDTATLQLDDPDFTGYAALYIDGETARIAIQAKDHDVLTVKGRWHMAEGRADVAIDAYGGDLVLDGSFVLRADIVAVAADNLTVKSGSLYADGGEIGMVARNLYVKEECGYVELHSGLNEPLVLYSGYRLADGFRITEPSPVSTSFRNYLEVETPHFHNTDMIAIRKVNPSSLLNPYVGVPYVRISDITGFEGGGSADDPYLIATVDDWNRLAHMVEEDSDLSCKYFGLANDLTVTSMIGSPDHRFTGHFVGCGHTLTFNCFSLAEEECAPFRDVYRAEFRDLRVAGTIITGRKYAAGLVSDVSGSCRIDNCVSDIRIVSAVDGDGTHGGFVATGDEVTFTGCVFSGTITGQGTSHCAGFLAWDRGGSGVKWCIYDGTISIQIDAVNFIRRNEKADSCYYAAPIENGINRGKQMRTVTSEPSLTIDFGYGVYYPVSGITVYPGGIFWNGAFRAGEGDQVGMRFQYHTVVGAQAIGSYPSAGEMIQNEEGIWILTMPDEPVEIRSIRVPGMGNGTEENPWKLNDTIPFYSLPSGWYMTTENMTYSERVIVNGDVHLVLGEGTTFTATKGIGVAEGKFLSISGSGTLNARREQGCAGIGGGTGENCGTVAIMGGTVIAAGGENAPAIGAGSGAAENGSGTLILGEMAVWAGETGGTPVAYTDRLDACRGGRVRLEPCDHSHGLQAEAEKVICTRCGGESAIPVFGEPTFVLPRDAGTIGDNAFEGLPLMTVVDAGCCSRVGTGAFRNCTGLTRIRLSRDCVIGEGAFDGCTALVAVYGTAGGTLEAWAAEQHIPFVEENSENRP